MKINIISDGDVSTVLLLFQVFKQIDGVDVVNEIRLQNLKLSSLANSLCVFCRNCLPGYDEFPKYLKSRNIPYIYYLDDNLWELKGDTPIEKYHSHPLVLKSLMSFVENASLVIVSTRRLEDYIVRLGINNSVTTLPNFIDLKYFDLKPSAETPRKEQIRIGYAGSAKQKAFEPVLTALTELKEEGYEFGLEFIGFKPSTNKISFKYYRFMPSYGDYISLVKSRDWDLALAPFETDYFWSFKSDNKYREYSALSIPAIYSNMAPYNEVIIDGHNGFLADANSLSWKEKIRTAITNQKLRKKIATNSRIDIVKKYDLNLAKNKWSEVIIDEIYITPKYLNSTFFWYFLHKNLKLYWFLFCRFLSLVRDEGVFAAMSKLYNYLFRC